MPLVDLQIPEGHSLFVCSRCGNVQVGPPTSRFQCVNTTAGCWKRNMKESK